MHARALPALLALALLAGCASNPAPTPPVTAPSASVPGAFAAPVEALAACKYATCYEPTIAADPQGRLFVADGITSAVAVSADGGVTWTQRDPPSMPMGLTGDQSDVIVQVAPTGRLYWSALLVVYPPTGGGAVLAGIQVAWSDDGAATWAGTSFTSPAQAAPVLYPDRQWLGFAHDGTLYMTYNQIPTGIWFARSTDQGKTWSGWTRSASVEGRGGGIGQSGPPVVDSKGRVFVPACAGAGAVGETGGGTLVMRSDDQGATFQATTVKGTCNWFPILTVAPDDTVLLANQPDKVTVSASHDRGVSFESLGSWGSDDSDAGAWPVPGPGGALHVAWYSVSGNKATLHVAHGTLAGGPTGDAAVGTVSGSNSRTNAMTDYASAAMLPDGRIAAVFVDGKHANVAVQIAPDA